MEAAREIQVEALETLKGFNVKLMKALNEMVMELRGNEKEDTWDYMDYIFRSLNWELQVINGTLDVLNEKEVNVEKENLNATIGRVNDAYTRRRMLELAQVMEAELLPFFKQLQERLEEVCT